MSQTQSTPSQSTKIMGDEEQTMIKQTPHMKLPNEQINPGQHTKTRISDNHKVDIHKNISNAQIDRPGPKHKWDVIKRPWKVSIT